MKLRVIVWRAVAPFDALSVNAMVFTSWEDQDRMGRYLEYAAPYPVTVETYFNVEAK